MTKYTAEDVRRERERRKATTTRDAPRCINCGRALSVAATLDEEHGLCDDCLMPDDD